MMTETFTTTYTKVDVRKVVECFEADLFMLAKRTQARNANPDWIEETTHDIGLMAAESCIKEVHVRLLNRVNNVVAAHIYTVKDGECLIGGRPGDNDWPVTTDGTLNLLLIISDRKRWNKLKENGQFKGQWGYAVDSPTDYRNMEQAEGRIYSSSAYIWERKSYIAK